MNAAAPDTEPTRSSGGSATGPSLFPDPRPARKPIFRLGVAIARSAGSVACMFLLAGCPGTTEHLGPPPDPTVEPGPDDAAPDGGADSDAALDSARAGDADADADADAGAGEEASVPDAERPLGDAATEPLPPKPLRLADYNTHDFFDDQRDGDEQVVSTADYQAHLAAVGAVLRELDPDIAVLQEIEKRAVLDALADGPLASAGYATRLLLPGNDPRGIHLGVLSRYAFDDVVSHENDSFVGNGTHYRYARDCLELHLSFNGRHVALLGVHFKAKAPPDDPDKRLAEAEHTRSIADTIAAFDPTTAIVVLGDFNDTEDSPAVAAMAGLPPDLYTDVAQAITTPGDAWTFLYKGQRQLIDHQMANPILAAMLDAPSVSIPHGSAVTAASDHAPIAATYLVH